MAKKRTKDQKKRAQISRKTEYVFSENSGVVQEPDSAVVQVLEKKATTPKLKKRVESSFGVEITELLYQDLRKTGIVTAVVFCVLFGIYMYVR